DVIGLEPRALRHVDLVDILSGLAGGEGVEPREEARHGPALLAHLVEPDLLRVLIVVHPEPLHGPSSSIFSPLAVSSRSRSISARNAVRPAGVMRYSFFFRE